MITIRQYAPGEIIIKEQEPGETAFIIEKGNVEVSTERSGHRMVMATLESGAVFGEMSMVDDKPRSATVTALEETLVREIHRDGLFVMMKESPDSMIKLLTAIFERLREANMTIAHLTDPANARATGSLAAHAPQPAAYSPAKYLWPPQPASPAHASPAAPAKPGTVPMKEAIERLLERVETPKKSGDKLAVASIEGLTSQAIDAMQENPFTFTAFPLKIGRRTKDPLVNNHLELVDQDPLQISRHHVSIVRDGDKLGALDRGSQLGALVDGVRIGGKKNGPGPVYFKDGEGILILGTDTSPYRYKVKLLG